MTEPNGLTEVLSLALRSQDAERYRVVGELNRRKIKHLYHFTHIDNLESILRFGLRPKTILNDEGISFVETDPDRLDEITQSVSFSLEYPNEWLLKSKIKSFGNKFVMLQLPASLLLSHPFLAFPGNAAGGVFRDHRISNPSEYIGLRGIQNMFLSPHVRNLNKLESNEPTDIQAEVLILSPVGVEQVKTIHVPENIDSVVNFSILFPKVDFHFSCSCDYFQPYVQKPYDHRRFNVSWRVM
jgi:hypothetical protein